MSATEEARKRFEVWWGSGEGLPSHLEVWLAAERAAFDRCAEIALGRKSKGGYLHAFTGEEEAKDIGDRILKERP